MRKDQCLFCTSRNCYTRIVSSDDNGATYDEVACSRHSDALYSHSDKIAPGVMKLFISGIGREKRGAEIESMLEVLR